MRLLTKAALAFAVLVVAVFGLRQAGPALVINRPQRADVILVLAGDSNDQRYWRGIGLLRAGYAGQVLVDAHSDSIAYGRSPAQLQQEFIDRTTGDLPGRVRVCPTTGESTALELKSAGACLESASARTVMIVTSDFHTRRALSVAQKVLPGYQWTVAATDSGLLSHPRWWANRRVAKNVFLEWEKLTWWEVVERHR